MAHAKLRMALCESTRGAVLSGLAAFMIAATLLPVAAQQKSGGPQMQDWQKQFFKKKWDTRPLSEKLKSTTQQELSGAPQGFAVPIYPGKFVKGWERRNAVGKFTDLRVDCDAKPAVVSQWYFQALQSGGWKLDQKMPTRGGRLGTISGYKEGKTARVSVSRNSSGGSSVGVSMVEPPS